MEEIGLLGLFCGIAVSIGAVISTSLMKHKGDPKFLWLGLMFAAIALRVAKSIWYFILFDVATIGLALGFLGLSAIGPSLLMALSATRGSHIDNRQYLHFAFPLIGFVACLFLDIGWVTILYKTATAVMLMYAVWPIWTAFKADNSLFKALSIGVLGVALAFVFQHVSETMVAYAWGAAIAGSILVYFAYRGFNDLEKDRKNNGDRLSTDLIDLVKNAFEVEHVYLNEGLTSSGLAFQLKIPAYQVPKVVKYLYNKSFPEALASFRVNHAVRQLEFGGEYVKIDILATECGFKSTSAFYAAFKRIKGNSPKEYQRLALLSEPKSTSLDLATT